MSLYEARNKLAKQLEEIEDKIKTEELTKRCHTIRHVCEHKPVFLTLARMTDTSAETIHHLLKMETWDDDYEIEFTVRRVREQQD